MNLQDNDIPEDEDPYPCVGLCNPDPETGYCEGCGRPPLESQSSNVAPPTSNETPAQTAK